MTQGVVWKQLLGFAIPMSVGLLFQQMYNTFDAVVVGQFVGKEALAAVGSTGSIVNMLVGLCAGLSTGASVVISQAYGAKDYKKLSDAVHTTILVTFILSIVATVSGILLVPPMLRLMNAPEDVFPQAKLYLTIYFSGVAGLLMYNMGAGILRAVGDSRRPLYFLIFSATLDIGMNFLFVVVFHWDIKGVAYSTVIAQVLSAALVLYTLTRTDAPYAIRWGGLRIKPDILKKILSIGLPASIQQAVTSFSNVFVQSYINSFGSGAMAGWSSYNKIDSYALVPVQSISLASTTFVGQNYGAGQIGRARKGVRQALTMSLVITAVLCALMVVFRRPLVSIFTNDPEVLDFGGRFLAIISPFYVLICFNQIFSGALRGTGRAKTPMIVMISSFVVFRQIYLFVSKLLGGGFLAVALAYPAGWVVCSLVMAVVYLRSPLCRERDGEGAASRAGASAAAEALEEALSAGEGIEG
ncbi:MAG TPA: MATE family efflux transporter [Clostridia bacterium]|nr:MATE family efflux transporter [Clostridia bacterium]